MKENLKEKENKMSLKVLMLESVGSCIDCTGTTYPLNVDGTPDLSSGVHYSDCCEEWSNSLSFDDAAELNDWVYDMCGDEYTYFLDKESK
jgi:hypothetical protein